MRAAKPIEASSMFVYEIFPETTLQYIKGMATGSTPPAILYDVYARGVLNEAFKGKTQLKKAILPQAIGIGKSSFQGCINLNWADFPNVVGTSDSDFTSGDGIGKDAFKGCTKLELITLASTTKEIAQANAANWGVRNGCTIVCSNGTYKVS